MNLLRKRLFLLVMLTLFVAAMGIPLSTISDGRPVSGSSTEPSAELEHIRGLLADNYAPFTIVCLGDALTEVNWTTAGRLNWVGLLSVGLLESGYVGRYTVINAGVSGNTARDGLNRLRSDVLDHRPDLVIVSFGTSDASRATPGETRESLRLIIDRIRETSPASIILRTPPPVVAAGADSPVTFADELKQEEIVEVIRKVASEMNVALVDDYALWREGHLPRPIESYYHDLIHPNADGQVLLYQHVAAQLGLKIKLSWMRGAETEIAAADAR